MLGVGEYFDPPGPLYRAITKQLKFYVEISHTRLPLHFPGKVTSKHWSYRNSSIHPRDMQAFK